MDGTRLRQMTEPLLAWFARNKRDLPWRADREPYHVWLSEIMLQQTRVEAVRDYYVRFLQAAPDVFALAALPEERLLKLWEGLGYYNRARNLQKCARILVERGGAFPDTVEELLALPGVGAYTAGAIASICFERPTAAVDGNVLRVCARVLDDDAPVDTPAYKSALTGALSACYPPGRCGDFTQSLMELGATVCVPNGAPKCAACPVAALCLARARGTAAQRPVKLPKRGRRAEERTVFLLRCGERTLSLNGKELEVLRLLMSNARVTVSKETIIARVWGSESAEENSVEAYISFLRKKLKFLGSTVQIVTQRMMGYRLEEAS